MNFFKFIFSKTFLIQLVIAFVGGIILFFGISKWLTITTHHNQKIEVPNLKKLSLNVVEKKLEDVDLKMVVLDSASYNPNYPAKSVIDQNPEAGDFVKENRKVYLTINPSGYQHIAIPNLYGKSKRQAVAHLLALGFTIDSQEIRVSDIAKDVVRGIKFNGKLVKAGTKLMKTSKLTLVLGDGKGRGSYRNEFQ